MSNLGDRMADLGGTVRDATPAELKQSIGTPRPTGQQIFDSLSKTEQDTLYGEEAANLIRSGDATLADFIEKDGGFIRRKPASDVS